MSVRSDGAVVVDEPRAALARRGRRRLLDIGRRATRLAGEHWQLTVLLSVGAVVRALMMVAYPPALFFPDSWGYITTAYAHSFIELSLRWPAGYGLLIRVLTLPGRSIAQLIALQHLSGLVTGVLVYAVLLRAGISRWWAAAGVALVVLDGYAITLEQYVMSDTFAALTLILAMLVLGWDRVSGAGAPRFPVGTRAAALSGALFAAAVLEREAALFVFPVLLIYLIWIRTGWRGLAAFLACALIPLGAYAVAVDGKYKVFGVTAASGWTLYGRVAGFADCADFKPAPAARPLCQTAAQRARQPNAPDWYIWGPSPAVRLFKPSQESIVQSARDNAILERFARQAILSRPLKMVSVTLADFLRYLTPDATPYGDSVSATSLPANVHHEVIENPVLDAYLPGMRPQVQAPAGLMRAYRSVVHVPRPILALLALISLLALCLRVPGRREIFLFSGGALILLLGTAATGGFSLRYLIPAVAPLAMGGGIAVRQVLALWGHNASPEAPGPAESRGAA